MDWSVVFNAIGVAFGVFLAAVLARTAANATANRWLAGFLLAYSLVLLSDVFDQSRLLRKLPHLAHTLDWALFLLGPLLWKYVSSLTQPARASRNFLWHCLPAALLLLLFIPFYALPAEKKLAVLEREWAQTSFAVAQSPPLMLLIAQIAIYLALCFIRIRRYHRELGEFYSNLAKRRLDWLWMTLAAGVALFGLWLAWIVTQAAWTNTLDALGFPIVVYLLGYLGLRQPQVFIAWSKAAAAAPAETAQHVDEARPATGIEAEPKKYEKSALPEESAAKYRAQISAHFALEKPHLESDLTLPDLAQRLNMSQHHLSQMLNTHFGQNFFDFINQKRVEEVQRCLCDPLYASQTILEIALASGFSSKATFNAVFKKFAGTTPSEYRNNCAR